MATRNQTGQQKLKLAGFLLNFAELDRAIELNRQALTCCKGFEPYSAFQRLAQYSDIPMSITPGAMEEFLRDVGINSDHSSLETIVNVYSSKLSGFLDFEDFLRLVLSREASDARFEAAKREVPQEVATSSEIEYFLGRLIQKLGENFRRLKVDPETQTLLADPSSIVSSLVSRQLDFSGLQNFFKQNGVSVPDKDVLAVLRLIDINDDGVVDRAELEYFLSVINVRHHGGNIRESLAAKIKVKARVSEAEELGMKRTREAREELRALTQTYSSKNSKGDRSRKTSNFFNETRELREVEKISRNVEPTFQRYERTYVREERKESPPRSVSKSVEAIARERRAKRDEAKRETTNSNQLIETPVASRTQIFPPRVRQPHHNDEDFFVSNFRALKPLHPPEEQKHEYKRPSALNTVSKETYSVKRSIVEEEKAMESPFLLNTRTPTKSIIKTEERRTLQSKENRRRPDRDASLSKSANRIIKESIRTEEVIRRPRDTGYTDTKSENYKPRDGLTSSVVR